MLWHWRVRAWMSKRELPREHIPGTDVFNRIIIKSIFPFVVVFPLKDENIKYTYGNDSKVHQWHWGPGWVSTVLPIRALGVASTPSFIAQKKILHKIQCNENLFETIETIFLKKRKRMNWGCWFSSDSGFESLVWPHRQMNRRHFFNVHRAYETAAHQRHD